jgi:hypothetical protein
MLKINATKLVQFSNINNENVNRALNRNYFYAQKQEVEIVTKT